MDWAGSHPRGLWVPRAVRAHRQVLRMSWGVGVGPVHSGIRGQPSDGTTDHGEGMGWMQMSIGWGGFVDLVDVVYGFNGLYEACVLT